MGEFSCLYIQHFEWKKLDTADRSGVLQLHSAGDYPHGW
uniref:Uncharacterized protein n=1 Tax=Arundo donax TaxID=35708 RepID=A0A0A9ECW3_ARUDO